jgi:hypothetical protein
MAANELAEQKTDFSQNCRAGHPGE